MYCCGKTTDGIMDIELNGDQIITGDLRVEGEVEATGGFVGGSANFTDIQTESINNSETILTTDATVSNLLTTTALSCTTSATTGNLAVFRNTSAGTTAYGIVSVGNNNGNPLNLFLNSSNRVAEGGPNTATLRNDVGDMRLMGSTGSGINCRSDGAIILNGLTNVSNTGVVNAVSFVAGNTGFKVFSIQATLPATADTIQTYALPSGCLSANVIMQAGETINSTGDYLPFNFSTTDVNWRVSAYCNSANQVQVTIPGATNPARGKLFRYTVITNQ